MSTDARDEADRLIAEGNRAEDNGRVEEARDLYRRAVAAAPDYARAHVNLGIALEALGDVDAAAASHQAALAVDPSDPYASYNLSKLRLAAGAPAEANQLLARSLEGRPDFREALVLQGYVLSLLGRAPESLAAFESALAQHADFGTLFHYAQALRALDRLPAAASALERALELEPGNVDARAALADVLAAQGDAAGSAAALELVLAERPAWPDALYNYGCMLRKLRRLPEAEAAFRRAIAEQPLHARAYQMLGAVLLGQSLAREALELYRDARLKCPDDEGLASAELFALLCAEEIPEDERFARHVAVGRQIERAHPPRRPAFRNSRDPGRRLRIGYLSGDFCYHVVTLQMLAVLEHHDRAGFEAYCYSATEAPDSYTQALQARAARWRAWPGLDEEAMAQAIAADDIDILVDLAGHSSIPQLAVMAQRPAPIQATWIGYLSTTGLAGIDYRISDAVADPPGLTERYHTEAIARLPRPQWCWRPFFAPAQALTPPCTRNGYVTFGSFHGAMKLAPGVRRRWAEILARVPGSRFVALGVPSGRAQDALVRDLGVARERVTLVPYVSLQDYMRWYDAVDVILDPAPYSGATTTCDALFMGVPVITAPGVRTASRSAASILSASGLGEFVCDSGEDYVRRAVELAGRPERLADLRRSLRSRLQASPVMDAAGFTRELEAAYRRMWERWCSGLTAQGW
jgi:predicted O-linked N-acetylglucosamine transferase (SPINDLY family)